MVCLSRGRMMPPISRRVDLTSFVSQRTVYMRAARELLQISLNDKLSISSSRTMGSSGISSFSERSAIRRSAHATKTRRAQAMAAVCPSKAECRAPVLTRRTSMEKYNVTSAAHPLYLGKVSCMGGDVRVVVTYRRSCAFLPG